MIKTLPGIFADVCYFGGDPTIVTIEGDYRTVNYIAATIGHAWEVIKSDYQLLFLRAASDDIEIRCVVQVALPNGINQLGIIKLTATGYKLIVTPYTCSGQEGCYIQYRDGKFVIYNKIDSWNYIILQEDDSFTTHPIGFGTAQGIIDVIYDYPGIPDGTIFWGEERTRQVGNLKLVYPVYREGVNFGQEYSKVDRLVGVDYDSVDYLVLDNKLGKYPHLAVNFDRKYIACWAELNDVIGYTFLPPFPPYTPPVIIEEPEPEPIKIEQPTNIHIPDFKPANHDILVMIAGEPNSKRLSWLDDPSPFDADVVGVHFNAESENLEKALNLCKKINKPLYYYLDGWHFEDFHVRICNDIEDTENVSVVRCWHAYPLKGISLADNLQAQKEILARVGGLKAPWLAFYRQVKLIDNKPVYNLDLQEVVDTLGEMWELLRNDKSVIAINGFEWDRGNRGIDGVKVWDSLQVCANAMEMAGNYEEPIESPIIKLFKSLGEKIRLFGTKKKEKKSFGDYVREKMRRKNEPK